MSSPRRILLSRELGSSKPRKEGHLRPPQTPGYSVNMTGRFGNVRSEVETFMRNVAVSPRSLAVQKAVKGVRSSPLDGWGVEEQNMFTTRKLFNARTVNSGFIHNPETHAPNVEERYRKDSEKSTATIKSARRASEVPGHMDHFNGERRYSNASDMQSVVGAALSTRPSGSRRSSVELEGLVELVPMALGTEKELKGMMRKLMGETVVEEARDMSPTVLKKPKRPEVPNVSRVTDIDPGDSVMTEVTDSLREALMDENDEYNEDFVKKETTASKDVARPPEKSSGQVANPHGNIWRARMHNVPGGSNGPAIQSTGVVVPPLLKPRVPSSPKSNVRGIKRFFTREDRQWAHPFQPNEDSGSPRGSITPRTPRRVAPQSIGRPVPGVDEHTWEGTRFSAMDSLVDDEGRVPHGPAVEDEESNAGITDTVVGQCVTLNPEDKDNVHSMEGRLRNLVHLSASHLDGIFAAESTEGGSEGMFDVLPERPRRQLGGGGVSSWRQTDSVISLDALRMRMSDTQTDPRRKRNQPVETVSKADKPSSSSSRLLSKESDRAKKRHGGVDYGLYDSGVPERLFSGKKSEAGPRRPVPPAKPTHRRSQPPALVDKATARVHYAAVCRISEKGKVTALIEEDPRLEAMRDMIPSPLFSESAVPAESPMMMVNPVPASPGVSENAARSPSPVPSSVRGDEGGAHNPSAKPGPHVTRPGAKHVQRAASGSPHKERSFRALRLDDTHGESTLSPIKSTWTLRSTTSRKDMNLNLTDLRSEPKIDRTPSYGNIFNAKPEDQGHDAMLKDLSVRDVIFLNNNVSAVNLLSVAGHTPQTARISSDTKRQSLIRQWNAVVSSGAFTARDESHSTSHHSKGKDNKKKHNKDHKDDKEKHSKDGSKSSKHKEKKEHKEKKSKAKKAKT